MWTLLLGGAAAHHVPFAAHVRAVAGRYYQQLEENWKTVKALGDVDPAVAAAMGMGFGGGGGGGSGGGGGGGGGADDDTLQQVKDAVAQVLAKDGVGERRPISFDVDDFVKLLHDFNAVGIHFS